MFNFLNAMKIASLIFFFLLVSSNILADTTDFQTVGPYGGTVLSMSKVNGNIYISLEGGAIYKSQDEGGHWQKVMSGLNSGLKYRDDILQLKAMNNSLYAFSKHTLSKQKLYKLDPEQERWESILQDGLNLSYATPREFWVSPTGTLYLTTDSYSYVLKPNDFRWNYFKPDDDRYTMELGGVYFYKNDIYVYPDEMYPTLGTPRFFKSSNNGVSWQRVSTRGLPKSQDQHDIAEKIVLNGMIIVSSGTMYVATPKFGVYQWDTSNNSWIPVNSGLNNRSIHKIFYYDNALTVQNDQGLFKYDSNTGVWVSYLNDDLSKGHIVYSDAQSIYVAAKNNLFQRKINSTSWKKMIRNGITEEFFKGLFSDNEGNLYAFNDNKLLQLKAGSHEQWNDISMQLKGASLKAVKTSQDKTKFYLMTISNKVLEYNPQNNLKDITYNLRGYKSFYGLNIDYKNNLYLRVGRDVYKLAKEAKTWTRITYNLPVYAKMFCISFDGTVYVLGGPTGLIYKLNPNSERWQKVDTSFTVQGVNKILFSHGYLYAITGAISYRPYNIYRLESNNSWTRITNPGGVSNKNDDKVFEASNNYLYVGGYDGETDRSYLMRTGFPETKDTWELYNQNLPPLKGNRGINLLSINPLTDELYSFLPHHGIYKAYEKLHQSASIKAILSTKYYQDKYTYFFLKTGQYARFNNNTDQYEYTADLSAWGITHKQATLISGAVELDKYPDKRYLFLKNGTYLQLKGDKLNGSPKDTTANWNIPKQDAQNICGAIDNLEDTFSRYVYIFICNGTYYKYDGQEDKMVAGPRDSTTWGLNAWEARNIIGIIKYSLHPNKTYFFFSNGTYRRYDDSSNKMDVGYPLKTYLKWGF